MDVRLKGLFCGHESARRSFRIPPTSRPPPAPRPMLRFCCAGTRWGGLYSLYLKGSFHINKNRKMVNCKWKKHGGPTPSGTLTPPNAIKTKKLKKKRTVLSLVDQRYTGLARLSTFLFSPLFRSVQQRYRIPGVAHTDGE
jgi:hypothetical protein